ncbi:MAG: sulfite oxidase-like oxidoreductase [Elusimicrobia bacterium CG08_land_8_20_14_0_20_51_18]|nr:MAG: sulfite oxidase-like oxidoreductase [Elusimicrobia bacterium CG08_land_8_20_14_0_20_51_18]
MKKLVSKDVLRENRLPPGQRGVEELPVLDLGKAEEIKKETWTLEISGLVENPVKISFKDLLALPQSQLKADIHCVTTWSKLDTYWEGVQTAELIKLAKPLSSAAFVLAWSEDGYSTALPLADFSKEDSLTAHKYAGEDLPHRYGGPVRLLVPSLYFWKSAKWLKKLEFLEKDRKGYWEERGYHAHGDPWTEERYGT